MTIFDSTEPGDLPKPADSPSPSPAATLRDIPSLRSPRSSAQALVALDRLSLKGKLPGYTSASETEFKVALFGEPFDRDLIARIDATDAGCELTFSTRLRAKAPTVFALSLILSIWPGVLLMDSLIPASWGWWPTWMWYFPITIAPYPLIVPRMWKKSHAAAEDHLQEQLTRIARAIDAPS